MVAKNIKEFKKMADRRDHSVSQGLFAACDVETYTLMHKFKGRYVYEIRRYHTPKGSPPVRSYSIFGKNVCRATFFRKLNK